MIATDWKEAEEMIWQEVNQACFTGGWETGWEVTDVIEGIIFKYRNDLSSNQIVEQIRKCLNNIIGVSRILLNSFDSHSGSEPGGEKVEKAKEKSSSIGANAEAMLDVLCRGWV